MNFHMSALLSLSASLFKVVGRHASQLPRIKPNSLLQKMLICEAMIDCRRGLVRKNWHTHWFRAWQSRTPVPFGRLPHLLHHQSFTKPFAPFLAVVALNDGL